jgi:crotonobetainyl-CoA:carnitine CoA-transferase CaiB-like acyl-CoA transferase
MTEVMKGFRILEVAEHTFVPAASALLAEWGAEVIKVEHQERGDAMRGLASTGVVALGSDVHVLLEHSNRGKRSIGLDLATEQGLDILYKLVATADVFLTNKLPGVLARLHIDESDIKAHNPNIIYVRGTGQGTEGPDADKGSYDSLAYWARSGVAMGQTARGDDPTPPPAPAFGDSIGAMTIAGGIMGALLHRERTGEATSVDVSLLGTGLWSMGAAVALSMQLGVPWRSSPKGSRLQNPLANVYRTSDDQFVSLTCLQFLKYWPEACEVLGRPELVTDERFAGAEALTAHTAEAAEELAATFASRTGDEWRGVLERFSGQWSMVQDCLEAAADRQVIANGYIQEYETAGGTSFRMVSPPVKFGGEPATPKRAPEFNEHGDAILEELGVSWDEIVELKIANIVP